MRKLIFVFVLLLTSLHSYQVKAFPNMVRHGYTTCITCHYNASGGGSLTSYGKYIAGETLGTFNNYETALGWLKKPAEYGERNKSLADSYVLAFLGRVVQYQFETESTKGDQKRRDLKVMQADLEAAVDYNDWVALITGGPRVASSIEGEEENSDLFIRRWYVGHQAINHSIKAGKFFPEYGINLPNHNNVTRKELFFNHNQEPMTVQASYYTPSFDVNVSLIKGNKGTILDETQGYVSTIAYKQGSSRFGVSHLKATDSPRVEQSTSLFGTVGYGEFGYTLFEGAKKTKVSNRNTETVKYIGYVESGWEVKNGVIPFLNWEFVKDETAEVTSHSPGVGLQFTPWTHFELVTQYQRLFISRNSTTGHANIEFKEGLI
jgi:hypothetical protein